VLSSYIQKQHVDLFCIQVNDEVFGNGNCVTARSSETSERIISYTARKKPEDRHMRMSTLV
jgi:hypothetical protein